jgi:hypothetical protein
MGVHPTIGHHRGDGDVLRLQFQDLGQLKAAELKELLAEHLRGFRETFGKSAG